MASTAGFNNEQYLEEQSRAIVERAEGIGGRLYLEFGGKITYDFHAARVLPGYDPNVKIRLLQRLKDRAEIIVCIYAGAIERRKVRADFGIPYDVDALKLIDDLREWDLLVRAVVITRFEEQPSARVFKARLQRRNIPVYTHGYTRGYPTDVDRIVVPRGSSTLRIVRGETELLLELPLAHKFLPEVYRELPAILDRARAEVAGGPEGPEEGRGAPA